MISNISVKSLVKRICFVALFIMGVFMLTACSYSGYLELRGDVTSIRLVHYDNPDVGFARNTLGFAIGRGRYKDFNDGMVETLEYLDQAQFENFLTATYDRSFFGHVAGRPDSPNGLAVLVEYESGEFDVISSSFTAHFETDGTFESYVASWRGIEEVIYRYFETDITWFLGRTPPTVDEFSQFMRVEGFNVVNYTEDVGDVPGVRRKVRAYFPTYHSEAGSYIEFIEFWGPVRSGDGFEARREEMLDGVGSNHVIQEERIVGHMMTQVYSRGNVSRAQRASDVMISALSVSEEYSEWIEALFEMLFLERVITD